MAQQVKAFASKSDGPSFEPWNAHDGRRELISAHYLVTSTHMQCKVHLAPSKINVILENLEKMWKYQHIAQVLSLGG